MIGYLTGTIKKTTDHLLIMVSGVGYQVITIPNLFSRLQDGESTELFIYTHVKEDKFDLYGFQTEKDLKLFELVLSVSGVGPKIAILIIDGGAEALVSGVQNADVAYFTKINRVGKKLAQKIIIDLESKLGSMKELDLGPISDDKRDLFDGLLGLGFEDQYIREVIKDFDLKKMSLEKALKQSVRALSSM